MSLDVGLVLGESGEAGRPNGEEGRCDDGGESGRLRKSPSKRPEGGREKDGRSAEPPGLPDWRARR